ncbi:MAG: HEAT repeat domain-containing protein [bacterium]|nr:HEAT repeat domain-containing protein [bacterium]
MIALIATGIAVWIAALVGPDSPVRNAAVDSLVAAGDVQATSQAVYDTNWRGREGLIQALERMGAVGELAGIAERHTKLDAKRLAIRSLGRSGKPDARVPLRLLLTSENRDLAAEGLGLVGDATDIVRVRALLSDDRSEVRRRAALALVGLHDERALDALAELLGDPNHAVRFGVYPPLLQAGQPGAAAVWRVYPGLPAPGRQLALRLFGDLRYQPARDMLEKSVAEGPWPVQLSAVRAIGAWGKAEGIDVLKKAARHVSSPIVQAAIRDALAQLQKAGE